jgi:glucokinase
MRIGMAPKLHELTGGSADRVDPRTMAQCGDEAVRQALLRAASWLGIGVANMVSALHPDLVVLGGGVAAIGPLLTDTVAAVMRERVRMFPPDDVRVERSALEDKAGLFGGIALAARHGKVN